MTCDVFTQAPPTKWPAKGAGESVGDLGAYTELNHIPLWTHGVNDDELLVWRGLSFRSHSHAFQDAKFVCAGRADVARQFSVEGGTGLGTTGSGLDAHKARKIVRLSSAQLAQWRAHTAQTQERDLRSQVLDPHPATSSARDQGCAAVESRPAYQDTPKHTTGEHQGNPQR